MSSNRLSFNQSADSPDDGARWEAYLALMQRTRANAALADADAEGDDDGQATAAPPMPALAEPDDVIEADPFGGLAETEVSEPGVLSLNELPLANDWAARDRRGRGERRGLGLVVAAIAVVVLGVGAAAIAVLPAPKAPAPAPARQNLPATPAVAVVATPQSSARAPASAATPERLRPAIRLAQSMPSQSTPTHAMRTPSAQSRSAPAQPALVHSASAQATPAPPTLRSELAAQTRRQQPQCWTPVPSLDYQRTEMRLTDCPRYVPPSDSPASSWPMLPTR